MRNFTSKKSSDIISASGVGSKTVNLGFVPNYIRVKFRDGAGGKDNIGYSLSTADNAGELTISWSIAGNKPRDIKFYASQLSVNPEATISFSSAL